MIACDYHVHTRYCDGKSTVEEIVLSAIQKGMTEIGFSGHSYTDFDESYCMSLENTRKYIEDVNLCKEKYKDKITILCGLEKDLYADDFENDKFEYFIGSVHYIKFDGEYYSIDYSKDEFVRIADKCFGGDYYSFAEYYYEAVGTIGEILHPDIIGHFDMITKFNENDALFDTSHPRYIKAWKSAVDKLIPYNIPFEVNTGAISRGYRTSPYPSEEISAYIASKGGRFVLSSDSHHKDSVCFFFDKIKSERADLLEYNIVKKL